MKEIPLIFLIIFVVTAVFTDEILKTSKVIAPSTSLAHPGSALNSSDIPWHQQDDIELSRPSRYYDSSPAKDGEYPFFVQLVSWSSKTGKKIVCGSAVDKHRILTCGHCIQGLTIHDFEIYVGSIKNFEGDRLTPLSIENLFVSEDDGESYKSDLAIITVKQTIKSSQIIELIPRNYLFNGEVMTLIGFGPYKTTGNIYPEVLQVITVRTWEDKKEPSKIYSEGASFKGDSGGSAVHVEEHYGKKYFYLMGVFTGAYDLEEPHFLDDVKKPILKALEIQKIFGFRKFILPSKKQPHGELK